MIATHNILRELSRRGHEITVCSTWLGTDPIRQPTDNSISFSYHKSWIEGLFFSPSLAIELVKRKISEFDIIHVINCRNFPSTFGLLLGPRNRGHLVLSANGSLLGHQYVPNRGVIRSLGNIVQDLFLRRFVQNVAAALAVSQEEVRHYTAYGVDMSRISVVGNGIDLNIFRPGESDFRRKIQAENDFVVAYVGRLDSIKGLPVLVRAFHLVLKSHRNSKLVFIGPDFGMRNSLLKQAKETGVESKISFIEAMPPEELVSAYRGIDVVAVPSHFEIFGMSALEAMACGTPVVGSNIGGLKEIVEDGVTGFLVPPGNPEILASKLLVLANTSEKRTYENNAVKAATRFDIKTVGSKIEEILIRISG